MDAIEKKIITRSISLPVQECLSGEWKDFMKTLHGAWRLSTDLANWASHTLATLDVTRTPAMKELPKYAGVDLYALAFGRAKERNGKTDGKVLPVVQAQFGGWEGARIAAASLLRRVQSKYAKERGKIIWRRERRTPEYLYPVPFPVHGQAWAPFHGEHGEPVVSLALPGGRASVRLRQGTEFGPALRVFDKIIEGTVKSGELSVCRQRSYCPDRKDSQRLPGGGHRETYRIMLRISYQYEVPAALDDDSFCEVRTAADPFITLSIPEQLPWVLHSPQIGQHIIAHRAFLDRFADDLKFEKRWPRGKRRRMLRRQERGCDKQNRRLKSFCQETAAHIVGYATRRKIARIIYCDTDKSFVASFPWHLLREAMCSKCEEAQIRFEHVEATEVASEDGD